MKEEDEGDDDDDSLLTGAFDDEEEEEEELDEVCEVDATSMFNFPPSTPTMTVLGSFLLRGGGNLKYLWSCTL